MSDVPRQIEESSRLRPEEILAQSFGTPFRHESNDGWSPRSRRFFLAAMAMAGAMLVTAGLLVTGELGPGPTGSPKPLESGPDASALAGVLQPDGQPAASSATPTTGPSVQRGLVPASGSTTGSTASASSAPVSGAATQATPPTTRPTTPTTSTTLACNLLGSKALSAQLPPPLCR